MTKDGSVEDFWNDPDLVASYSSQQDALRYEIDLIETVTSEAASSQHVRLVHVIGVGGGRELRAIRDAAPDADIRAWDISSSMVEACRNTVRTQGLERIVVEQADVGDMSEAEPGADTVIALGAVLGYSTPSEQRESNFVKLRSLLRTHGTIAIVVQQRWGRPDWAAWLTVRSALAALGVVKGGPGDRLSRHGGEGILFHHYSRRELRRLCSAAGLENVRVESLRQWGRRQHLRVPLGSPNPLLVSARAADGTGGQSPTGLVE